MEKNKSVDSRTG